ncbi:Hydrogen peroxide-inducible genes activator [Roseovarius sp. THAF9]|uniref:LysR family transcriptional regulator n=1 Tax=Roseovarius sp. THAF9 TaxID=2587847 RepID=UPI001267A895|nr:LysR family transcriptional regulator [Roseovarius sp. THAF9]QFT92277.1 Hydrogen peroxide-inducible genes activator [Roseovarius sp. THAF9]
MLDLKDLQFLTALARQKHFARAAEECGVSQPAFSMRIAKLEEHLETKIVHRGNRFQGLTPDGESIVRHALQILEDVKRLETEFSAEPGDVTGVLSLAVIPTAAALAAKTVIRLREANPGITVRVKTMNSLAILHGLEAGTYDAGITYTDSANSESAIHSFLSVTPIDDEEYVLLVPAQMVGEDKTEITWKEAGTLPLCLLEPGMQNRHIIDTVFQEVGTRPRVVAELSGLTAGVVMAIQGAAATVVPKVLVENTGAPRSVRILPLVEPEVHKSLSLVTADRGPALRTVQALKEVLR